jgi:hypothetical protein
LRIAVGQAAQLIGAHPNLGKQRRDLASENIRFLLLRGFPLTSFEVGRRHWEATRLPVDSPPPLIAFSDAPRP